MTEQEMWLALAKSINRRARGHLVSLQRAQQDYDLAAAYARDAMLTPLEAAHAGLALDEYRFEQAAR